MADPIMLEVFKNRFSAVAEEMGVILQKTAFSPNIKERRDFSCAVFDREGRLVAQAAHIPVHLGSMPMSVRSAISHIQFEEGDMVVLNNPYRGGTHLPDVTLIAPVFIDGELTFFVANRAHHSDIGGSSSGSMPLSRSIFQEGLIIPPVKLVKKGEISKEVMEFIKSNVRTPEEREGDFMAQVSANTAGIKRLKELVDKYSKETVLHYMKALNDYSERVMRSRINEIPDGTYTFTDYMEDDGVGNTDIKISVEIKIDGQRAVVDFSGSDDQTEGSINAVRAITLSAVYYVFRSLVREDIPTNDGCFRPIEVITRKGSVVDCQHPFPVAAGKKRGNIPEDSGCSPWGIIKGYTGRNTGSQPGNDEQPDYRWNTPTDRKTFYILRDNWRWNGCIFRRRWGKRYTVPHDQHPEHPCRGP